MKEMIERTNGSHCWFCMEYFPGRDTRNHIEVGTDRDGWEIFKCLNCDTVQYRCKEKEESNGSKQ